MIAEPEEARRVEIGMALQRILAEPEFEKNRNCAQFLKFIVEETLAGRGDRLKAFTIATMALNRDASFDAQNNSIVRVLAGKLRQMLQAYYLGAGSAEPVRISLPVGGYQPQFEFRAAPADVVAPPAPVRSAPRRFVAPLLLLGAVALVLAVTVMLRPKLAAPPDETLLRPLVELRSSGGGDAARAYARRLADDIEGGLSAYDDVAIRRSQTAEAPSDVRYLLQIDAEDGGGGGLDLAFRLIHRPSGEVVWSRDMTRIDAADADRRRELGRIVIVAVGDVYGAIANDALARAQLSGKPPRGYACILAGFAYLKSRRPDDRAQAVDCLKTLIASEPDNARALSLQAIVLVRGYLDAAPDSHGAADLEDALQAARRAYDRAPNRARSQTALFLTRFYDKRFDDAFDAARKALATNPNSSLMRASVGAAHISRGDYAAGEALLQPLQTMDNDAPRVFLAYSALAAYMQGQDERFNRLAQGAGGARNPLGLILRIISCGRNGRPDCAAEAARSLHADFPGFASDIPASFDRYALADDIKARLLRDLAQYSPKSSEN